MADFEIGADFGSQAASVTAGAFGEFSGAFKAVHIGGGAADIQYIALEKGLFADFHRLLQD